MLEHELLIATINFNYKSNAAEPIVDGLINFHFSQFTRSNLKSGCIIGRWVWDFFNSPLKKRGHGGREANTIDANYHPLGPWYRAKDKTSEYWNNVELETIYILGKPIRSHIFVLIILDWVDYSDAALHCERHRQPHRCICCGWI